MKRIGILGDGQLARMLALAAYPLGAAVSVLQKNRDDNGMRWQIEAGDWDDPEIAVRFAKSVDVVTLENEFVNQDSLEAIEQEGFSLFPSAASVRLVQDKLVQKQTLAVAGLPVPSFFHSSLPPFPLVLKRRRLGYDGKGNFTVRNEKDLESARAALGPDTYAESFVDFERELAVMITRGRDGSSVTYPVVETLQENHVCRVVKAPAEISEETRAECAKIAKKAVESFGGVGSWGVEMFLLKNGSILINEMAPRVHNSGHYTIEACECSQFENHLRAILGLPLGSTKMLAPAAAMINLFGAGEGTGVPTGLEKALAVPGAHVHVYGKDRSVKGRKMGHVTALGDSVDEALSIATRAAQALRFGL